ncbi:hypothetical protein B0J13DRAFT_562391 [Dactylonectria estremocensis]|uniref:Secreted protein n=1 Tax=Dactylonectria estremocensis TaxID=1079267 RepID=A0A9P9IV42_9HYPO|nr:hypothetical protein B0J13DRAFT_562391 [Dactylonectria estremocensis]
MHDRLARRSHHTPRRLNITLLPCLLLLVTTSEWVIHTYRSTVQTQAWTRYGSVRFVALSARDCYVGVVQHVSEVSRLSV